MTRQTLGQPQRVEPTPVFTWEPLRDPGNGIVRARHTSCCGAYELASLGGEFFVLRPAGDGHEETGRGIYRNAVIVYMALVQEHRVEHWRQGEQPEYDALLDHLPR
jgi:hypothetical protein